MCKKILSLLAFFHICMMMIFSCCETQTEDAPKETPPATSVNPQKPTITVVSDKTLEYKVNDTRENYPTLGTNQIPKAAHLI